MRFLKKLLRNQDGVVESTLVIIPLMIVFLISVELIVAVNYRNLDLSSAQSAATTGAITSVVSAGDEVVSLTSGSSLEDLRILITHRRRLLPNLLPRLSFLDRTAPRSTEATGIAVMEDSP